MIDTIEALEAWWPPTLRPDGLGLTRLAWSTIAIDSQSTRCSTDRSTSRSPAAALGPAGPSEVLVMPSVNHPATGGATAHPRRGARACDRARALTRVSVTCQNRSFVR